MYYCTGRSQISRATNSILGTTFTYHKHVSQASYFEREIDPDWEDIVRICEAIASNVVVVNEETKCEHFYQPGMWLDPCLH